MIPSITIIDHISIEVKKISDIYFYEKTLGILGYTKLAHYEHDAAHMVAFGKTGEAKDAHFWVTFNAKKESKNIGKAKGFHIAFQANSIESINEWYKECLSLGGKDNGEPGPRPIYHPGYYGAFIVDPSGWRIEACFHNYESKSNHE